MRRDQVGKIIAIGNGLCRVIVRSEKLAEKLRRVPGVDVRDEDAELLGWWVIFPETLRPQIEPIFTRERTIYTKRQRYEQMSLLDEDPDDDRRTGVSVPPEPSGRTDTPAEPRGGTDTPAEPSGGTDTPAEPSGGTDTPAEPRGGTDTPVRRDDERVEGERTGMSVPREGAGDGADTPR